eukprot:tig00001490_g8964.t1
MGVSYKAASCLLRWLAGPGQAWQHFVAGALSGYLVFGRGTAVNAQIVLYLFSRSVTGLARLAHKRGLIEGPSEPHPWFAAVCWGLTLLLWEREADVLQPSLAASLDYLHRQSDRWPAAGWRALLS